MNTFQRSAHGALVVMVCGILAVLPGCTSDCGSGGKSEAPMHNGDSSAAREVSDGSAVLFTLDGKPVITENMVADGVAVLKEQLPKGLPDDGSLDANLKCAALQQLKADVVIDRQLTDTGARSSSEYQQKLAGMRRDFDRQWFLQSIDVSVSDSDVRKYYNDEKETFIISAGGRNTKAVHFKDKDKAEEFLGKIKGKPGSIGTQATEADYELKDYNLVHQSSYGIDAGLREKIMKLSVPATQLIKMGDGDYWVVAVTEEEEPKYYVYDEIKDQLREMLEPRKLGQEAMKRIDALREKYQLMPVGDADKYSKPLETLGLEQEGNGMGDDDLPPMPSEM